MLNYTVYDCLNNLFLKGTRYNGKDEYLASIHSHGRGKIVITG